MRLLGAYPQLSDADIDDGYQALMQQAATENGTALKKYVEDRFNVDIYVSSGIRTKRRAENRLCEGSCSETDIAAAKATITATLSGDANFGSVCLDLYNEDFYYSGRGLLCKLRRRCGSKADVLKPLGQIRLRGPLDAGSNWVNSSRRVCWRL